jgi:hypothetical protein
MEVRPSLRHGLGGFGKVIEPSHAWGEISSVAELWPEDVQSQLANYLGFVLLTVNLECGSFSKLSLLNHDIRDCEP